jgi:uncharacterized alkaline shock family protein YloU
MKESNQENTNPAAPEFSDDQGKLGEIKIALNVVENMVRMITLEVEGVVDIIGSSSGSIAGMFSSKSENRTGVKVVEDEAGAYAIEVRVSLAFGVELAPIAYTIQSRVIERISRMTSNPVTKVDVFIDRVEKPRPATPPVLPEADSESKSKKKTASKPEIETKAEE